MASHEIGHMSEFTSFYAQNHNHMMHKEIRLHNYIISKGEFTLHNAIKAHRSSRDTALLFLQPWHLIRVGGQ